MNVAPIGRPAVAQALDHRAIARTPTQDAQDVWDNEDGPDWEAFNVSHVEGWEAGCDLVSDE